MDITAWLRGLGLEQYAPAFCDNGIDLRVLPELTADDLKDLGITMVGHRRILLKAIASLRQPTSNSEPSPTPPTPDTQAGAERRQVTVMFCDLVGSTALASRLDPEDLREVIGRYHACVAQTVSRFDGFVAKYMGDGVLVYFGYPHAHEDDAEQAVRAGLALIDAVGELQATEPLQVRIGMATGLVVVGDLIGASSAQEQAIVGETPNLAARLQALAGPNTLVIPESTRRQIGTRFEVADLGRQSLKGFAEPQLAWRVLSENRALGRFEALRSGATPLIGRDEELELLLRRWEQAKAGGGRVVLISGEPGVGKSRLTEALAERIAAEPYVRLRYFCSPHHQDSALYPVIAQMARAAGFAHDDAPAAKIDKLQSLLAPTAPTIGDAVLITDLHSLSSADIAPPLDVSPQRKKEKTFEALLRHVERLSRHQPVLMVFEDIHWIDPSSRELLDRAMQRIASWPVLLVATFRPEFQPPWTGQPNATMLPLARLDRRDTAVMVANVAGKAPLPTETVQEIVERSDGVPLFIEELTKAVVEADMEDVTKVSAASHPVPSVPTTLHASLTARLDRLGPAAKDVAQTGSVVGREFSYELIMLIADLPELQLREALERLTNSGLLFERGMPAHLSYTFKHAMVQDTAYGMLLRSRRQQLHARISVVLEERFSWIVGAQPELVAHHFTAASLPARAIEYWLKAGQQALARSGMVEAEVMLSRGLKLVSSLPDSAWRQEQELIFQFAIGRALMATEGYGAPAVAEVYARAGQLRKQLNRSAGLLPILYGQWVHLLLRADLEEAQRLAADMQHLGDLDDNVVARVMGGRAGGVTSLFRGGFAAARADVERSLMLYDPVQRPSYALLAPQDMLAALLGTLGLALVCLGYLDRGAARRFEALAAAGQSSDAYTLVVALHLAWVTGWIARSEPKSLLQHLDELLALSAERGFALWRASGTAYRGWCLAALGCADQGIPLLASGAADLRAHEGVLEVPLALTLLVDACRMAGQTQAGLAHLAEAERLAAATKVEWILAEMRRLRGDLLILTGGSIAAEASYGDAIALAQRQGAKLFELRSATSLARLWRDQGRRTEARELLAPIYNWFTEGFDAPDLIEAKALLVELGC